MLGLAPVLIPFALLTAQTLAAVPEAATTEPANPTIALTTHEERMTVPVEIAGAGPYRFIIDTGAERTVIARSVATALGLPPGPLINVTAMSGMSRVGTVIIPSLRVGAMPNVGAIQAPALDETHLGAHGLLGIDTVRHHRVVIDFERGTMAVAPSEPRRRVRPDEAEIVVRAKSLLGQLIVTDAQFGGRPVRLVIDTGSTVSVGNSALRRLVARRRGVLTATELTSATGGIVAADYALVDGVWIAGTEFINLPIAFADAAPFARFGLDRRPAMLLGMNALRFFRRVEIDFPNREIRFLMPRPDRVVRR